MKKKTCIIQFKETNNIMNQSNLVKKEATIDSNNYHTNVILASSIASLLEKASTEKKRNCYKKLKRFITEEQFGKVAILYGLKNTGKSALIFQIMSELPSNEVAYIKIKKSDDMFMLNGDLQKLYDNGYKYIFIDDITLMKDFINTAAILSDVFSMYTMKIVISGIHSLSFYIASGNELYDRNIMIHTSYISFKEYSNLDMINSIDEYIEFGGIIEERNETKNSIFKDAKSTRKYIDESIIENIIYSLENSKNIEFLSSIYNYNEIIDTINYLIEKIHYQLLLNVLISNDYANDPKMGQYIYKLKELIDVKEKEELKVNVTQNHVDKIKKYLEKLDLLYEVNERYESGGMTKINIITQPGMRYAITKALVYSLLQDKYFSNISESDKTYIINKLLEDVKGRMLEDIVLLEKSKSLNNNFDVFKYKFDSGEFDMVIYNRLTNTCEIYEIKHATQINPNQTKHLNDNRKCAHIERFFGEITNKYVLYRGDNKTVDDVKYVNIEEYLCK